MGNFMQDPQHRVKFAWIHLIGSVILGAIFTVLIARDFYERTLMAVSWYAITITALDVLATTDVRREVEGKE